MTTFAGGGGAAMVKTSNMILNSIDLYERELAAYELLKNHGARPETLNRKGQTFLHQHTVKTRQVKNLNGRIVTESIPLTDSHYVRSLSNLAKIGKVVGPGLVLLDGYFRYENVAKLYQDNNPKWKRQAVVETTSFAAGLALAGTIASVVVLMTPAGLLVGLVVGGGAAVGVDLIAKEAVGFMYDKLTR